MKVAKNWGLAWDHLIEMARKENRYISVDDVEVIYPGAVYDGDGQLKQNPIHVVIPEAMPGIDFSNCSEFFDSGRIGYLKTFLPPFTSKSNKN